MGWAKYCEDNIEIMLERQYMNQDSRCEPKITVTIYPRVDCVATDHNKVDGPSVVYEEKYIVCKDCGKKFLYSADQQRRFESRGWAAPKRCKHCRDLNNARYLMAASF